MKQSRAMSLVEAIANVVVGYGVAVATQMLVFPVFGLQTTLAQNLKMGAVFTVILILRGHVIRWVFNSLARFEYVFRSSSLPNRTFSANIVGAIKSCVFYICKIFRPYGGDQHDKN